MSVPPDSPPPRPARGNAGCFQALGITCLALLVLGIVAVLALFPLVRAGFQTGRQIVAAQRDGEAIRAAILTYHQRNGQYPASLISLVTDGESDGRNFHSPLDPSSPAHLSWRYTRPAEGAPGETPLLSLPYQVSVWGHSVPGQVTIDLNGATGAAPQPSNSP